MSTSTYLELNTSHITKSDVVNLDQDLGPIRHQYPEGYFIVVPGDERDLVDLLISCNSARFSDDFLHLLFIAHKAGHALLRLDRDADIDDKLPVHEW